MSWKFINHTKKVKKSLFVDKCDIDNLHIASNLHGTYKKLDFYFSDN